MHVKSNRIQNRLRIAPRARRLLLAVLAMWAHTLPAQDNPALTFFLRENPVLHFVSTSAAFPKVQGICWVNAPGMRLEAPQDIAGYPLYPSDRAMGDPRCLHPVIEFQEMRARKRKMQFTCRFYIPFHVRTETLLNRMDYYFELRGVMVQAQGTWSWKHWEIEGPDYVRFDQLTGQLQELTRLGPVYPPYAGP